MLLEEAALESPAPDIAVRQEGYTQADPEQEVATEADSVAEDTMPSSHQYAVLTDTGGWKMHEPSPPRGWTAYCHSNVHRQHRLTNYQDGMRSQANTII
jgi:hypothetical protein